MSLIDLVGKYTSGNRGNHMSYTPLHMDIWERHFCVGSANGKFDFLRTSGILTCVGLTIYDTKLKEGLMAHVHESDGYPIADYDSFIKLFASACDKGCLPSYYYFGIYLNRVGRYGGCSANENPKVVLAKQAIRSHFNGPKKISVFMNTKLYDGLTLDLKTGEVRIGL